MRLKDYIYIYGIRVVTSVRTKHRVMRFKNLGQGHGGQGLDTGSLEVYRFDTLMTISVVRNINLSTCVFYIETYIMY